MNDIHELAKDCDREYTAKYHGGNRPLDSIKWIVLHDTEGSTAEGAARYFNGPERTGSAHFCIDASHCYRTLNPNQIAYAAYSPANELGLHFEQAGFARWSQKEWVTLGRGTIERTAYKCAYWAKQLSIPTVFLTDTELKARKKGFTYHAQISRVLRGDHTDPGPNYPFTLFMQRVRAFTKNM